MWRRSAHAVEGILENVRCTVRLVVMVAPYGRNSSYLEVLPMAVRKGSYSLDERAAEYLDRRAKLTKRSASAVLSELVAEAARQDARDRALKELGEGVEIPEREVQRWLKKLGAMGAENRSARQLLV